MAGGQSRRMAQDKAMLQHPQADTFLSFSIGLLRGMGLEVAVSGTFPKNMDPEIRFVADQEGQKGPLAGLNAILSTYPNRPVLVIPVDMPALTSEILSFLMSKPLKNNSFGRIYTEAGTSKEASRRSFYPFPLFLSSLAQGSIKKAMDQEKWALMSVLESLDLEEWPLKANWASQMRNVNTPKQLQSFYDTPGR